MSHPIAQILKNCGYHLIDNGKYWKTTAHYRAGKNPTSLSINKKTGRFWDFSSNLRGTPEELVKLINGEADITGFASYVPIPDIVTVKTEKTYPKEILKKLLPDYDLFLERGISEETLRTFEAGMAHAGKLNRRICFPIYNRKGKIHGFDARWHTDDVPYFDDRKLAKWKKIGQKLLWTFPTHLNDKILRERKEIIIVESIGDVLALWEAGLKNVLCSFGTSMSSKLMNYIIGLDPQKIIIATNNDLAVEDTPEQEAKGPAAARKMKKKLEKFFSEDKMEVRLPTKKDFGEMSKKEILKWYESLSNLV